MCLLLPCYTGFLHRAWIANGRIRQARRWGDSAKPLDMPPSRPWCTPPPMMAVSTWRRCHLWKTWCQTCSSGHPHHCRARKEIMDGSKEIYLVKAIFWSWAFDFKFRPKFILMWILLMATACLSEWPSLGSAPSEERQWCCSPGGCANLEEQPSTACTIKSKVTCECSSIIC